MEADGKGGLEVRQVEGWLEGRQVSHQGISGRLRCIHAGQVRDGAVAGLGDDAGELQEERKRK